MNKHNADGHLTNVLMNNQLRGKHTNFSFFLAPQPDPGFGVL
jgi:hypothetical protein